MSTSRSGPSSAARTANEVYNTWGRYAGAAYALQGAMAAYEHNPGLVSHVAECQRREEQVWHELQAAITACNLRTARAARQRLQARLERAVNDVESLRAQDPSASGLEWRVCLEDTLDETILLVQERIGDLQNVSLARTNTVVSA